VTGAFLQLSRLAVDGRAAGEGWGAESP